MEIYKFKKIIKEICKKFFAIFESVLRLINSCVPKHENRIMFESNSDYTDNSRAVYEYIKSNLNDKTMIWIVNNPTEYLNLDNKNVKFIKRYNSRNALDFIALIKHMYYVSTSKYLFFSHSTYFAKCNKNLTINLWHGTMLKNIKGYVPTGKDFDYVICPNEKLTQLYMDSFECENRQILISGNPRNDYLFKSKDINIYNFGLNILWMPTFRKHCRGNEDGDNRKLGVPIINSVEDLTELNEVLQVNNVGLIIKLHPAQDLKSINLYQFSNIKMLTNKDLSEKDIQLYELIGNSDALITDYSSVYMDYLLINKQIGFAIDDLESYRKNRGFTVENPLEFMPGEKLTNIEELKIFIEKIKLKRDTYEIERLKLNKYFNKYIDNKNSERIINLVGIK